MTGPPSTPVSEAQSPGQLQVELVQHPNPNLGFQAPWKVKRDVFPLFLTVTDSCCFQGPGKPGQWQQGLCECCCDGDPESPTRCTLTCCIASTCCQLCVYSDAAFWAHTDLMASLGGGEDDRMRFSIWPTCCGLCGLGDCVVPCSDWAARYLLRREVVKKYHIPEGDLTIACYTCCCAWCVLDQQLHEIMVREQVRFTSPIIPKFLNAHSYKYLRALYLRSLNSMAAWR